VEKGNAGKDEEKRQKYLQWLHSKDLKDKIK
jgi:hypothetical protein